MNLRKPKIVSEEEIDKDYPFIKKFLPEIKSMTFDDANEYLESKIFYQNKCQAIKKTIFDYSNNEFKFLKATRRNPEIGFLNNFYDSCSDEEKITLISWLKNKVISSNKLPHLQISVLNANDNINEPFYYEGDSSDFKHACINLNIDKHILNKNGCEIMHIMLHELKHFADDCYIKNRLDKKSREILFNERYVLDSFNAGNWPSVPTYDALKYFIYDKSILTLFEQNKKQINKILDAVYMSSSSEISANHYALNRISNLNKKQAQYVDSFSRGYLYDEKKTMLDDLKSSKKTLGINREIINSLLTEVYKSFNIDCTINLTETMNLLAISILNHIKNPTHKQNISELRRIFEFEKFDINEESIKK